MNGTNAKVKAYFKSFFEAAENNADSDELLKHYDERFQFTPAESEFINGVNEMKRWIATNWARPDGKGLYALKYNIVNVEEFGETIMATVDCDFVNRDSGAEDNNIRMLFTLRRTNGSLKQIGQAFSSRIPIADRLDVVRLFNDFNKIYSTAANVAGRVKEFAKQLHNDCVFLPPGHEAVCGAEAVKAYMAAGWETQYGDDLKKDPLVLTPLTIEQSGDNYIVSGKWAFKTDTKEAQSTGKLLHVTCREGENMKFKYASWNADT